jgi:hypothetical protein
LTDHTEILLHATRVLKDRTAQYGSPMRAHEDAASIASTMLKKHLTAYDIAMIMHAVKLSRMVADRHRLDHYEDGINYLAFAGEFATAASADTELQAINKTKPYRVFRPQEPAPVEPAVDLDVLAQAIDTNVA